MPDKTRRNPLATATATITSTISATVSASFKFSASVIGRLNIFNIGSLWATVAAVTIGAAAVGVIIADVAGADIADEHDAVLVVNDGNGGTQQVGGNVFTVIIGKLDALDARITALEFPPGPPPTITADDVVQIKADLAYLRDAVRGVPAGP